MARTIGRQPLVWSNTGVSNLQFACETVTRVVVDRLAAFSVVEGYHRTAHGCTLLRRITKVIAHHQKELRELSLRWPK